MKKYIFLLIFSFILTACSKKVEAPATATVDDISTILEAKELDIDKLKAYLPVFTREYSENVNAFLTHPSKDEAERLERRNKSLGKILATLDGFKDIVDSDYQMDLTRQIKNLQRSKEDADAVIKKLLSDSQQNQDESFNKEKKHSSHSAPKSGYSILYGGPLSTYSVVVGSFSEINHALNMYYDLCNAGYDATVAQNHERVKGKTGMYRVMAASYYYKEQAEQARIQLCASGYNAWLLHNK